MRVVCRDLVRVLQSASLALAGLFGLGHDGALSMCKTSKKRVATLSVIRQTEVQIWEVRLGLKATPMVCSGQTWRCMSTGAQAADTNNSMMRIPQTSRRHDDEFLVQVVD